MEPAHHPPQPADLGSAEGPARLVEDALESVVALLGYEVVLVEWAGSGRGRILRVYLDHPEGVSLDDCAKMSRILGDALDAAEADPEARTLAALLSQPYNLEVSSPGLERPLVRRSHFVRFAGRRAVVRTHRPIGDESNQKTFHGIVEGAEPAAADAPGHSTPDDDRSGVVLLRDADSGILHRIPIAAIRRANLVYEG